MKVVFKSAEMANKAIRSRLLIGGRRCNVRKLLPEPRRCYKCQKIEPGHTAYLCPVEHQICGNCAENHTTQECPVADDTDEHKCTNCDEAGHGAANRDCPTYARKREELQKRNSELLYKFFPTADSATWELLNPSAATLVAYAPPVNQYRAANERQLAWVEERRRWTAEKAKAGAPSQWKRAQAHAARTTRSTAATSQVGAPNGLRQSTLQFEANNNSAQGQPNPLRRPPVGTGGPRPASAPPIPSPPRSGNW